MKNLFLIGGAMGIGKTTVSRILKKTLPNAVFLDGDWCWDADPFQVTAETKAMVLNNITALLSNFLACSVYENVIFCWVMHQQSIMDSILVRLDTSHCRVFPISLTGSPQVLAERIARDVEAGLRTPDVLERSLPGLPMYDNMTTIHIDTTGKTPEAIAAQIAALAGKEKMP